MVNLKCAGCGADLGGRDICPRCGKKVDGQRQKIEVEYKDFKVSELLEIRKIAGTSGAPYRNSDALKLENDDHAERRKLRRKRLIIIIVAGLLVAASAGFFYVLHFLKLW